MIHEHDRRPRNIEHPGFPIRCENCGLPIPLPDVNGRVWVYEKDGAYYDRPSCTEPGNRGQRSFEGM